MDDITALAVCCILQHPAVWLLCLSIITDKIFVKFLLIQVHPYVFILIYCQHARMNNISTVTHEVPFSSYPLTQGYILVHSFHVHWISSKLISLYPEM